MENKDPMLASIGPMAGFELNRVLQEAQGKWTHGKYRDIRALQIDKRGSFGERLFGKILTNIYIRQDIKYKDGDQGDWDLFFNGVKFEVKTASLDVNNKFQNEGLKRDGDYDGVLFLGVAPDDLYFRVFRKENIDFDAKKVWTIEMENLGRPDKGEITHLHDRGKDATDNNATGAGFKCDFKLKNMIKIETLKDFKDEFEKYFDLNKKAKKSKK